MEESLTDGNHLFASSFDFSGCCTSRLLLLCWRGGGRVVFKKGIANDKGGKTARQINLVEWRPFTNKVNICLAWHHSLLLSLLCSSLRSREQQTKKGPGHSWRRPSQIPLLLFSSQRLLARDQINASFHCC